MRTRIIDLTRASVVALLVLAGAASPARAALNVELQTASEDVAAGATFDVFVVLEPGDSNFNGFSMVLSYDPTALTLLPMTPTSSQEGCMLTGGCSDACGETFHHFAAAGDSINVNDVILCNLVSLTGPGTLYQLRFRAANRTVNTHVRIRNAEFFDAGIRVTDVHTHDLGVAIGANTTGVGGGPAAAFRGLRAEPNPAFGRVRFVADDGRGDWSTVEILDLQGRVVRRLGAMQAGARIDWDRTDERGVTVSAGVYMIRAHRGGETRESRFVLLQ